MDRLTNPDPWHVEQT